MEMLKLDARVSVTSVPYEDAGAGARAALRADAPTRSSLPLPGAAEHLESGRVRALAVTAEAPSADASRACR